MRCHLVKPDAITMSHWNIVILEFDDGNVIEKFLGLDTATGRYRLSSQILEYDAGNDSGKTLSGSRYRFIDKPGKLAVSAQVIFDALALRPHITVSLKYARHFDA